MSGTHDTKQAIASALIELCEQKDFRKISVQDITKKVGLNRQTFYYHFKDIYDLLEWIYKNEVIQEIEEKTTYETWQQGFLYIFEYILKNKEFVKNTYYSISKDFLLNFIYKQTDKLIMDVLEEKAVNMKVNKQDEKFIADFYKYGLVGLVQDWIEHGMKENPKDIINKLSKIVEGNFEKALDNFIN